MKRVLCILCSSAIIIILCISGCGAAKDPFAADNAIKGQVDDLHYAVPENAVLDKASNDSFHIYNIPLKNSKEEYCLSVLCFSAKTEDEYNETIQNMKSVEYENETMTEFLGKKIDYGYIATIDDDGQMSTILYVAKNQKFYIIQYSIVTGLYDQTVWDNFYSQLKFV